MITSRRNFLTGIFAAPAIIAIDRLMPVKKFDIIKTVKLISPGERFRINPGVYINADAAFYYAPYVPFISANAFDYYDMYTIPNQMYLIINNEYQNIKT